MTALIGAGVFAGVVIGYGYTGDTTARHVVLGCGIGLAVILLRRLRVPRRTAVPVSRRVTQGRVRRWALPGVVTAAGLWWAWTTHPALTALVACLTATVGLGWWRARCAWLMRAGQRTDLYKHYMADGTPLYYGISNHYVARCNQHADGSWWWFYVDPGRSTRQTWPNRAAALHAERAAITRDCPIGNTEHNRAWRQQQPVRVLMQDQAATHRAYAQPPPVITSPTPYASRRFA